MPSQHFWRVILEMFFMVSKKITLLDSSFLPAVWFYVKSFSMNSDFCQLSVGNTNFVISTFVFSFFAAVCLPFVAKADKIQKQHINEWSERVGDPVPGLQTLTSNLEITSVASKLRIWWSAEGRHSVLAASNSRKIAKRFPRTFGSEHSWKGENSFNFLFISWNYWNYLENSIWST